MKNWFGHYSSPRKENVHPAMSPSVYSQIGRLLQYDELILSMTLKYVRDTERRACRLVCRSWRDVCKRLPIRLGEIKLEDVAQVANVFPFTISFSTTITRNKKWPIFQLAYHHNLRHLGLCIRDSETKLLLISLDQMTQLQSLSLVFEHCTHLQDCHSLFRNLTELKRLYIDVNDSCESDMYPFTTVHKIRHLCIHSRHLLTPGRLKPAIPKLKLKYLVLLNESDRPQSGTMVSQAIKHYGSVVQALKLPDDLVMNGTLWQTLGVLRRLRVFVCPSLGKEQILYCLEQLKDVCTLRTLELKAGNLFNVEVIAALGKVTQLRSLTCIDKPHSYHLLRNSDLFSNLKHLRTLSIQQSDPGDSIQYCRNLIRLEMYPSKQSLDALAELKRISHLRLEGIRSFDELETALISVPRLRRLEVDVSLWTRSKGGNLTKKPFRSRLPENQRRRLHQICPQLLEADIYDRSSKPPCTHAFQYGFDY